MDPKMALKRLLGEILACSRLSWAVLGHQQAFFESSGSTMIASSLSRRLLGGFFGSFEALLGQFLELFSSIQGFLGPLGRLMGSAKVFVGAASGASSAILSVACKLPETAKQSG